MADDHYSTCLPKVYLTPVDVLKIIDSVPVQQLRSLVAISFCRGDQGIVSDVRAIVDRCRILRKVWITSLANGTAADALVSVFSIYGEIEQANVDVDRDTGSTLCSGSVTFRHADSAILALKQPSKQIHGRMTFSRGYSDGKDLISSSLCSTRMVFVANVPPDMRSDRLLAHFSSFGEIEEGPLGIHPLTGKFMGFAIFIFKNVLGVRNSLLEPIKNIDGHDLLCSSVYSGALKPGAPLGGVPQPDLRLVGGVVAYEQGIVPGSDGFGGYPLITDLRGAPYTVMYYPPADSNPGQRVPSGQMNQNMPPNN